MILPECQQAFDRLMQYFAWLLEDYGFVVIHCESGSMGYCGFTLESGDAWLFMEVERGFLQFGQLALAPPATRLDARQRHDGIQYETSLTTCVDHILVGHRSRSAVVC